MAPPISRLQIPWPGHFGPRHDSEGHNSASQLWDEFWSTTQRLSDQTQFETFLFLLARYGWNLPGTITDRLRPQFEFGISVFEQFKAVVALSHCLDPEDDEEQPICLVAGDIPGIQRMLYTITSKVAANTLRWRSAYLLVLSDALVRLVLQYLNLPCSNVVFGSSGKFLIVAAEVADQLEGLGDTINPGFRIRN